MEQPDVFEPELEVGPVLVVAAVVGVEAEVDIPG